MCISLNKAGIGKGRPVMTSETGTERIIFYSKVSVKKKMQK